MTAMALMLFALFQPGRNPYNPPPVCTYKAAEERYAIDWDWTGKPISLHDKDGWQGRTINPRLVCFGQGKKKRVICGELSGEMEF